jgi:hypothetical protein
MLARIGLIIVSSPKTCLGRHYGRLVLAQRFHHLLIEVQVRLHQLRRGQGHPLIERHVGKVAALEDLEKPQGRRACVLDIMTHREWDIADIAGSEVERPRLARGPKHTHAPLAFDPILPFVSVGVPVKLAHCARFNLDQCRSNLGGNREYAGIRNACRPTFGLDRLLRHQTVAVALRYGCGSGNPVGRQWSWNRSGKNITVFWVGRMAEQRGGNAEVLSQHLLRYVLKPFTDQEGIVLVEIAVIKDQEKLGTVRIKALD